MTDALRELMRYQPILEPAPDAAFAPVDESASAMRRGTRAPFTELLDSAREIEMRRFLLSLGVPPIGPRHYGAQPITIRWSDAALEAIRDQRETPPRLVQNWDCGNATLLLPNPLSNVRKRN